MEKSCYSKVHTKDDWGVVEAEAVRICCPSSINHRNQYPGMRRNNNPNMTVAAAALSPDIVLVKTGGNALKAVSRQDLLVQNNNNNSNNINPNNNNNESVLSVVVPANMQSGDALHVQAPDGRIIAVTIPPGMHPGQSFMVNVPPPPAHDDASQQQQQYQPVVFSHAPPPPPPSTTNCIPFSQALNSNYTNTTTATTANNTGTPAATSSNTGWSPQTMFSNMFSPSQQTTSNNTHVSAGNGTHDSGDLILVQVPAGYGPGSKLHVQVPDGRLVEATVPPGNVTEFYMRLPASNMPVARPIFP